jgi:hypothetical protein
MALEKSQRFGHWVWVVTRTCGNGHTMRLVAGDTRRRPDLPPGAVVCHCGALVPLRGGS